jgi:hypothetical protein
MRILKIRKREVDLLFRSRLTNDSGSYAVTEIRSLERPVDCKIEFRERDSSRK